MDPALREEFLARANAHVRRFEKAARRVQLRAEVKSEGRLRLLSAESRPLSAREVEVLRLIADGLTNAEIGERLHVTLHTSITHTRNVIAKLDARSRAHAVAVGFRRGLLP